jgi:RecJ-like exonuclease
MELITVHHPNWNCKKVAGFIKGAQEFKSKVYIMDTYHSSKNIINFNLLEAKVAEWESVKRAPLSQMFEAGRCSVCNGSGKIFATMDCYNCDGYSSVSSFSCFGDRQMPKELFKGLVQKHANVKDDDIMTRVIFDKR